MNAIEKREQTNIVPADAGSIMAVISRAAADPNTDVVKLEKMLAMYERITAKNSEAAFNQAMAQAQSEMRRVTADAVNPNTKSLYASYAALDRMLRPVYTSHGFALSFDTGESTKADHMLVLCYVAHRDGHSRTYKIDMPADGKGAKGGDVMTKTHAAGSAMTYGQRYLLKAIFNVAIGTDDDGNAAQGDGMNDGQRADFEAAIEALIDRPSGEKLWASIVKVCNETKDKSAYDDLKSKITAKMKGMKK